MSNRRSGGSAPFLPASLREALARFSVKVIGIFLVVTGGAVALSLITYSPQDPSWNTAAGNNPSIHNMLGVIGSHLADILIQTLGIGACFVALFPMAWGWRLLIGQSL